MLSYTKPLYRARDHLLSKITRNKEKEKKQEMSKVLHVSLDAGDASKLEVLKKRFMFSEDIDVIRYLLTQAFEEIASEIIEMERVNEKQRQQQKQAKTTADPLYS